jgi:DNA-binding transcriptional MerR regulator
MAINRLGVLLLLGAGAISGCSTSEVIVAHSVNLVPAEEFVPEDQLLDIGVVVFNPGVPDGEIDKDLLEELIKDGTFVQIRRAESLYMAVKLRETLQQSGYWGQVWVTPEASNAADINITAQILHSDGEVVQLQVRAVDAAGRVWLDDEYEATIPAGAYNQQRYGDLDPYQDVFNEIANDLVEARAELDEQDIEDVRMIASLRYAEDLSPEAFGDYVSADRNGVYSLNRLPSRDDPQFSRTQRARQRELLFFETLDQHYASFSNSASTSYASWREYSREEAIQIREITRSQRTRLGLGIASILASVAYGSNSDGSFSDRVVRDALMYVGMDMIRSNAVRRQEKQLHTETLQELSASFDDEVEPLVVDIQGTEHRLTGTADIQYQEWKDLLRELYREETGFTPEEMEIYLEPEDEDEEAAPLESAEPALHEAELREQGADGAGGGQSGA